MFTALLMAALKATVLITLLMTGGQRVMRWWLTLVARRKSEELFVLNLLLVTLGLAWITELAGLSLALGAFIAGMLISETEYKHQVELDIRPFHDVLLGLFFITIGMMLDWHIVVERWPLVLVLTTLPVLVQIGVGDRFGQAHRRASNGVALRTGLYLAQAGEFGFVLLTLGAQSNIIPPALLNPVHGQHGAVHDGHAFHHHAQRPHRAQGGGQRVVAAVLADDHHRPQVDQHQQARHHLRLRALRPEPGAHARKRKHPLHGAGPGPGPCAPSRCSRRLGRVW